MTPSFQIALLTILTKTITDIQLTLNADVVVVWLVLIYNGEFIVVNFLNMVLPDTVNELFNVVTLFNIMLLPLMIIKAPEFAPDCKLIDYLFYFLILNHWLLLMN